MNAGRAKHHVPPLFSGGLQQGRIPDQRSLDRSSIRELHDDFGIRDLYGVGGWCVVLTDRKLISCLQELLSMLLCDRL